MPTRKGSVVKYFWEIWTRFLDDLEETNGCVVVEGIHDREILVKLDVPPEKVVVVGSHDLDSVIIHIVNNYGCVYLFLDRDYRGKLKMLALRKKLLSEGVCVIDLWEYVLSPLKRYGFKSIRKVEEMKTFAVFLRERNPAPIKMLRRLVFQ